MFDQVIAGTGPVEDGIVFLKQAQCMCLFLVPICTENSSKFVLNFSCADA